MKKRKQQKIAAWFLAGLFVLALAGQALLPIGQENLQALTAQLAPTGGTAVYATEVREPETYAARVTELVQTASAKEHHRFVTVTVRTDDLTLQKDGAAAQPLSTYGADYTGVTAGEPVLPAGAVLRAIGLDAQVDTKTGDLRYTDLDGTEKAVNFLSRREQDLLSKADDCYATADVLTAETGGTVLRLAAGYCTPAQAEQLLHWQVDYADGVFTVSDPYQSCRLLVTATAHGRLNTHGATRAVTNGDGDYVLQYASRAKALVAQAALERDRKVKSVGPDRPVRITGISDRGGAKMIQSDRYKAKLKAEGKTGAVTVAVLDTGVDTTHSLFQGRLVTGYNCYNSKKRASVTDGHGHGTHVAGIVADNTPTNVKILPVKVLQDDGSGYESAVAEGIDVAVQRGAKVINMSLGSRCSNKNCPIAKSIAAAVQKKVTVVVASGNDCADTKDYCPARLADCITVAACNTAGAMCNFSNYGSAVDLTAPGENIESAVPGGGYRQMSGTSMASPFGAAAAAMLLAENSSLSPAQVKSQLKAACADMLFTGWDKYSGAGVLNFGKRLGDQLPCDTAATMDDSSPLELDTFGHAYPYVLEVAPYRKDGQVPTDRTFAYTSGDTRVATFDGCYVVPVAAGSTTLAFTDSVGKTAYGTRRVLVHRQLVWTDVAASAYAGGKGTKAEPYLIATPQQLARFANEVRHGRGYKNTYYKLTKDIDLAGRDWITASYYAAGAGMLGAVYQEVPFSGHFDGANHKIKNMTVMHAPLRTAWKSESQNYDSVQWYSNTGFLGQIVNSTVQNLGLENATVYSGGSGILCGAVYQGTSIRNCYTTGFSAGNGLVSMINNYDITVENCYSAATVLGNGITSMFHASDSAVGHPVVMKNVFFCGQLHSQEGSAGGTGFAQDVAAYNNNGYGRLINCFSTAQSLGGVGFAESLSGAQLKKCYYLTGNRYGIKTKYTTANCSLTAKSSSFFKTKSSFTTAANWDSGAKWDFNNTWAIDPAVNGGYPYLKKMKPVAVKATDTGTWLDKAAGAFAGGKGTREEPYLIANGAQLARLAKVYRYGGGEEQYFRLTADIDLADRNWYPIGGGTDLTAKENTYTGQLGSYGFNGYLDGNGHTISNLTVAVTGDFAGLIAVADSGAVYNLTLKNAKVSGNAYVGALCGYSRYNHQILNCTVQADVQGVNCVGGVVGKQDTGSELRGTFATGTVTATGADCGGAVGYQLGNAKDSLFQGTVTASSRRGSFSGRSGGVLQRCVGNAGCSLVGKKENTALFEDCYDRSATGKVNLVYSKKATASAPAADSARAFSRFVDYDAYWQIVPGENDDCPVPRVRAYAPRAVPTAVWTAASAYAGGKGTKTDPYLIANAGQLVRMRRDLNNGVQNVYYKQIADINLSGKRWPSERTDLYSLPTFGFNGNGCAIRGLILNGGALLDVSAQAGSVIENVRLLDISGVGSAGLVYDNSGVIRNCTVTGTLYAQVSSSSLNNMVTISQSQVGLVNAFNYGTIQRTTAMGTVVGNQGGLLVERNEYQIADCLAVGRVFGPGMDALGTQYGTARRCIVRVLQSHAYPNELGTANRTGYTDLYSVYNDYAGDPPAQLAEMRRQDTYQNFDFAKVWQISPQVNDGLPTLRTPVRRTITYNTGGGTLPGYTQRDYLVGSYTHLPAMSQKYKVFGGWYLDAGYKTAVTALGAKDLGNVTVYAKWRPACIVRFDPAGGKGTMADQTVVIGESTALRANSFSRTGYTFSGWATKKGGKAVYANKAKVKNPTAAGKTCTLYAVWKPNTYTVKFAANGGKKSMKSVKMTYGKSRKMKNGFTPPKGKVFSGWSTKKGATPVYRNNQSVQNLTAKNGGTVTLYANWITPKTYKITYKLNGGKLPKKYAKSYKSGTGATLPKPTRKGYTFVGWYSDSKCTKKVSRLQPWYSGKKTLYAKWKK